MTRLLERAVGEILTLPSDRQDEIATIMLELAENDRMIHEWGLTAEQVAEVRLAIKEDDWATPEEVEALFAKYR